MKTPFLATIALLISAPSINAAPRQSTAGALSELKKIKVVYAASFRGDAGFGLRLQREMRDIGFVWTRDRRRAQGLVSVDTDWNRRGFTGHLTIRNRFGKILWDEHALRPHSSNLMASQRLTRRLRAALNR